MSVYLCFSQYLAQLSLVFRVEYIVRFEQRDGVDSALVKWLHLDESHNKWIPKANLSLVPDSAI